MNYLFMLLFAFSAFVTSCKTPSVNQQKPGKTTTNVNEITSDARVFNARYGKEYEMDGNVIALYPDFKLRLISKQTITTTNPKKPHQIYTYEITTIDDFANKLITVSSLAQDKKHFYYSGIHFYYHSNGLGKINIYVAPQLLASYTF